LECVIDVDNLIQFNDVMSNFDHAIEKDIEEKLKEGNCYAGYAAWDFHGDVMFKDNKFICEIWRYHCLVDIIEAETLEEIMEEASDKWGYD